MNELVVLYFLLVFSLFLIILPILKVWRKKGDIFEPVFVLSLTFFMYFWLRCVYALIWGTPLLGNTPLHLDTVKNWNITWLYLILAYILFLLGYYCRSGIKLAKIFTRLPEQWSFVRAKVVIPAILMIGLCSLAVLVQMFGGFSYFLSNKIETFMTRGTGPFFMLCMGVAYSAQCVYILYLISSRRAHLVAFVVLLFLTIGVGYAIGIKGGGIIFPLFSMLISYHYLKKHLTMKHLLIFIVLIIMVFPIFIAQRATTDISLMIPLACEAYAEPLLMLDIFVARFMGFDPLVYAIRDTPAVMDYQYGRTMVDMFVVWIPQKLWPNKPIYAFGRVFPQMYFGHDENCSTIGPTILGEAYINFHVAGIIFVSLISGIIFRAIYDGLIKNNGGPAGVFIYAAILPHLSAFWEYHFAAIPSVVIIFLGSLLISTALSTPKPRDNCMSNLIRIGNSSYHNNTVFSLGSKI